MYVFGGWNGKMGYDVCGAARLRTRPASQPAFDLRVCVCACVSCSLNDLHVLDLEKMEWTVPACSGEIPSTRNNHATFVVGTKLFVHGGHGVSFAGVCVYVCRSLCVCLWGCVRVPIHLLPFHVPSRCYPPPFSSTPSSFSPCVPDGNKWLADLHCFDTEKMDWSVPSTSGSSPSARACHTTTLLNRKLYMFGGYDGSKCFNDLDVLDLDTNTWIQPRVSGPLPQARNAQTMTVVGDRLFLFGGHSGNKHLRDLHILDTNTMTWTQADSVTGQPPPGLRGHTATLIGSKIFLYGGYDGRGRSNDLYLLDPATLHWEHPPTTEHTPAGRQRHTACLVGSKKLFILGGFDGFKWLNDLHVLDVGKLEESAITTQAVTSLLSDLRTMLNNPDMFPDITFMVEDTAVYAHKAVLCSRSQHFSAMFNSGMKESREKEIVVEDWTRQSFVAMLEFLYTGSVADLAPDVAVELMGLSDHHGLDGLKALCETSLIQSADVANVCTLYRTAHRYGAVELKKFCLEFILKHNKSVDLDALSSEPALLLEVTRESMARHKSG